MMVETQNEISISQDQSFLFQLTIRLLHPAMSNACQKLTVRSKMKGNSTNPHCRHHRTHCVYPGKTRISHFVSCSFPSPGGNL